MNFNKYSSVLSLYSILLLLLCFNIFGDSLRSRKRTCHLALFPIPVTSSGCNSKIVKVQGCSGFCYSQSKQSSYRTQFIHGRNITSHGRCCRIRDTIPKIVDFGGSCGENVILYQAASCECSHCAND